MMIDSYPISFPRLGITLDFKNYFMVFGYPIYLYAIIICVGLVLAYVYASKRCKDFNLTTDNLLDGLLFGVPVSIVGARLFYVIGAPEGEIETFGDIFRIRDGGLSIFGTIISCFIFILIFCKVKKLKLGNVLDIASLGFLIGQIVGRWGNFVNREVYGVATTLPWGMKLENVTRHPLFLYESLWNLLGFLILHKISKKRKFPGEIALLYIAWYGLGRGLMEGLRETSYILMIGDVAISRVVSFTLCVIAIFIFVVKYIEAKKLGNVSFEYETPEEGKQKVNLFNKRKIEKAEARRKEYKPMFDMSELEDVDKKDNEGQIKNETAQKTDDESKDEIKSDADNASDN